MARTFVRPERRRRTGPIAPTTLGTRRLNQSRTHRAPKEQRTSRDLITRLAQDADGVISTQVLQEFYVAVARKLAVPPLAAKATLKTLAVFETVQVSPSLIQEAIDFSILNRLSFWDALIRAAASAGCGSDPSEDLNPDQGILGVTVWSLFA